MDVNLLNDGETAGRSFARPTPEQSLLAHLLLGRAAYEEYSKQRQTQGVESVTNWDDLGDERRHAWSIAAWAVLSNALAAQDHEAAIMRVIAEPKAAPADDEPPPIHPPPPKPKMV
jgi:hypothetical protein